jgi:hypothetical protein
MMVYISTSLCNQRRRYHERGCNCPNPSSTGLTRSNRHWRTESEYCSSTTQIVTTEESKCIARSGQQGTIGQPSRRTAAKQPLNAVNAFVTCCNRLQPGTLHSRQPPFRTHLCGLVRPVHQDKERPHIRDGVHGRLCEIHGTHSSSQQAGAHRSERAVHQLLYIS